MGKRGGMLLVAALVMMTAAGCVPGGPPATAPGATTAPTATATAPTPSAPPASTVSSVIDGDTITTSEGTVRIIGIDAPERGACGHDEAAALASSLLAAGDTVVLELPAGQNAEDRHGRLLRYVDTAGGIDVGLALIEAGLAVARYDSRDGYPAHPRETTYRDSQLATLGADGTVTTVACAAAAAEREAAKAAADADAQDAASAPVPVIDQWWSQYSSCTKLKKNVNGHPTGPFSRDNPAEAVMYDWFAFGTGNNGDGDDDGLACE